MDSLAVYMYIREFKLQVDLLPKVIWVFTPHAPFVINAACETNDPNFEEAVEGEIVS